MVADEHAERFDEADLYRLKGEVLLWKCVGADRNPAAAEISKGQAAGLVTTGWSPLQTEAEACFQTALTIGRRQEAKRLELRAALSRSRLWQRQGKTVEARELLTSVYSLRIGSSLVIARRRGSGGDAKCDAGILSIMPCSRAPQGRGSRGWRDGSPPSCRRCAGRQRGRSPASLAPPT